MLPAQNLNSRICAFILCCEDFKAADAPSLKLLTRSLLSILGGDGDVTSLFREFA